MAVGFNQVQERVYTIRVLAETSDYIWSDERIEEAKARLNRAFNEFEDAVEELVSTIDKIDSIEIEGVRRGESKTI